MLSEILTPEPHFLPGYTGYCPQFRFRIGDTYGNLSHKLLIDPNTSHSENIILPTEVSYKEFQQRPTLQEINLVKEHEKSGDPLYKYPTIPGYCGFVPFSNNKIGARYSITTTEGIAEFEKFMIKKFCESQKLKDRANLDSENICKTTLEERPLDKGNCRLPLIPVNPVARAFKKENEESSKILPYSKYYPPHFMEDDDPRKFLKSGYTGAKPFEWSKIGKNDNSALCYFTKNYNYKKRLQRTPITINKTSKKPNNNLEKCEIYSKDKGMMPNYTGHVPGERFEIGKTYGKSTISSKNR